MAARSSSPPSGSSVPARSAGRGRSPRSRSSTTPATSCPRGGRHGLHAHADRQLRVLQGQGQDGPQPARQVLHGRRRRLPRRGRVAVPAGPQDGHDHLGGRQHLPGRDRERADHAPRRRRRRGVRDPERRLGRGGQGGRGAGRRGRARSGARSRDPRLVGGQAWRSSSGPGRSTSSSSCPATPTGSCTSASCATRTGWTGTGRSRPGARTARSTASRPAGRWRRPRTGG